MKHDQRLSRTLHVLIHMAQNQAPMTSKAIGQMLGTHPVVVRRTMAGLRDKKILQSTKGRGGGWTLLQPLEKISLLDVYEALGEPKLLSLEPISDSSACLVEQAVHQALDDVFEQALQLLLQRFAQITVAQIETDFQALWDLSDASPQNTP